MQTSLSKILSDTNEGREANDILRRCVHCGFCLATCPTYQLLGDELDSPRGRIYLVKQYLEGAVVSSVTQQHLDQCLLCRACETTCPSGVQYVRLIEIGRGLMRASLQRPMIQRIKRRLISAILIRRRLFNALLQMARMVKWLLPLTMAKQIGLVGKSSSWPKTVHPRKMLLLEGCVQPGLSPAINISTARVLDQLGISLIRVPQAQCCGALQHHLQQERDTLTTMKQTIDAWWPWIESGVEAIVTTASGCGLMLREYPQVLANEPQYRHKAAIVADKILDISQVLLKEDLTRLNISPIVKKIAFHPPCTLQHGMGLAEVVETLLTTLGFNLAKVADKHLCCGSAGTYSLLQPNIANALRRSKMNQLQVENPVIIATANIGCSAHLAAVSNVPVIHWIELLDPTNVE